MNVGGLGPLGEVSQGRRQGEISFRKAVRGFQRDWERALNQEKLRRVMTRQLDNKRRAFRARTLAIRLQCLKRTPGVAKKGKFAEEGALITATTKSRRKIGLAPADFRQL